MQQSLTTVTAVLVGAVTVAYAQTKIDLVTELQAIAAKSRTKASAPVRPSAQGCTSPTKAEAADAKKRALAWIDTQHPDEVGVMTAVKDSAELEINVGCKDAGGVVIDVSQDRDLKKSKGSFNGRRRNYVFRVSSSAVEVIAEDVSSSSMAWSEWADEGRISLLAQIDVDGDGASDIVYSDHEHEGGSTNTYDKLHVRFANGKIGESGTIANMADSRVVASTFVASGQSHDGAEIYVCLGRDLHLAPCAAAKTLQAAADRRALVERLSQITEDEVPDRELLAQELTTLGVPAKRRAVLVAAAKETQASDRVQRQVTAWMVKANLVEPAPMPELVEQTHAEARTYLDGLATKLGDTACTITPLTADEQTKANAWVKKQDAKAQDVVVAPSACGPFVWVAWWNPNGDSKRREVMLGRDGSRILGFTWDPSMPQTLELARMESWFTHDGTTMGVVIGGSSLWVIANGKIVAQSKGDKIAFYRYDDRWSETSTDIVVDGGTSWHATPTGREKLDRALVKDHEDRRAAIALLLSSPASNDAKYVAALQLLGADKTLIAAAKKLP